MSHREGGSAADAGERLWSFATAIYADAGVARACLRMQDAHGFDVNLLLFAAWCAWEARSLSAAQLTQAEARCEAWRREVVLPLRQTRRRWKGARDRAADYAAVKELEIAAERRQLVLLAQLVDDPAFRDAADGEDTGYAGDFRDAVTGGLLSRNVAAVAEKANTEATILGDFEAALRPALAGLQSAARKPPD